MTKSQIRKIVKDNNLRFTKSREDLIDIFLHNQTAHFTIDDLIVMLKKKDHVNIATVYNNLASFVDIGLVIEFNFLNKKHYEFKQPLHGHFICINCGDIFNVEIPGLDCLSMNIFKKYKAHVLNKVIEFEGCCENCQNVKQCNTCESKSSCKGDDV